MNDVTKLPKWAQDLLEIKDRRIADLEGNAKAFENPDPKIILDQGVDDTPLPDRDITFMFGNRSDMTVRRIENGLHIMSFPENLATHPRAWNTLDVLLVKDATKKTETPL